MSFGKSNNKKKTEVKVSAPPRITDYEYTSPLGDVYRSTVSGNKQTSSIELSGTSQKLTDTSAQNLEQLFGQLGKTDRQRLNDIRKRADDFYNLQAKGINRDADTIVEKTRSNLSNRFGGSLNSTFGTDLLAQVEDNRLGSLSDARYQSNLLAEDLVNNDEANRFSRINVFMGYLNGMNTQGLNAANTGTSLLQSENQRAQNLAITKAQLLQNAINNDNANSRYSSQSRTNALSSIGTFAGLAIGSAFGNPLLGAQLGGAAGSGVGYAL